MSRNRIVDRSRRAMLFEERADGKVRCLLCAHRCVIDRGKKGICQVRQNSDGELYTLVYGRSISRAVDPVEKKPLYHFHPGTLSYSIATAGCTFRCHWCQNWEISQMPREEHLIAGREARPEEIVADAVRTGSRSIAYTYTEPTVFFEYAHETARLAHEAGLANVFVTNGYMTEETLDAARSWLDGANVDLKAFRDATYKKYVGARLQPVLDSLEAMKRLGIWVEVTTLVVPSINDDPVELRDIASFIGRELGRGTPWHISRFFPTYKMSGLPPTPVDKLRAAMEIGRSEGLEHIYLGNLREPGAQDTRCPGCGETLIRRSGFGVVANRIRRGRCPDCSATISGVGLDPV